MYNTTQNRVYSSDFAVFNICGGGSGPGTQRSPVGKHLTDIFQPIAKMKAKYFATHLGEVLGRSSMPPFIVNIYRNAEPRYGEGMGDLDDDAPINAEHGV